MARNGGGVYSLPPTYEAVDGETATAQQHNDPLEDLESDANVARPIVAGGTGATTAVGANDALHTKGNALPSASTTNLAAATGDYVHVTGTATITAFGTVVAGAERVLVFDAALILTHNATSLILPGAANITTAAGDMAILRSEGSGNWRCISFRRAATINTAGIDDQASTEVMELTAAANQGNIAFTGTSGVFLGQKSNSSFININGGNIGGSGAQLLLEGPSTASVAFDYGFITNGNVRYYWDESAGEHQFTGNLVNGTYATAAGSIGLSYVGSTGVLSVAAGASAPLVANRSDGDNTNRAVMVVVRNTATLNAILSTNTTVQFNTSSDYRMKENVENMTGALARLSALRPVRFSWKANPDAGMVDGFIAHEVQEVVPAAVSGEKDGEEMQGIDPSKLVALSIAAQQEMAAILQQALARIETLEAKAVAA